MLFTHAMAIIGALSVAALLYPYTIFRRFSLVTRSKAIRIAGESYRSGRRAGLRIAFYVLALVLSTLVLVKHGKEL